MDRVTKIRDEYYFAQGDQYKQIPSDVDYHNRLVISNVRTIGVGFPMHNGHGDNMMKRLSNDVGRGLYTIIVNR